MLSYILFGFLGVLLYNYYSLSPLLINRLKSLYPTVIFNYNITNNKIALTIDDAPSPYTEQLLDILFKHNVKTTFFVIGNYVNKNDPTGTILKRIVSEGHEIGNHMMNNKAAILMSEERLKEEIKSTDSIITKYTTLTNYFRPGCGFFNQRMINLVEHLGYKLVLGNIYPHDPQIRIPSHNINHIMSRLSSGSIIILHDLPHNLQTLDQVLPKIKDQGFIITKLSEMEN